MKSASPNRDFPVSQRIYRILLRAYPRAHRREYGGAMAQLFRDQCHDAWNAAGYWGLSKLWLRVVPDWAITSVWEQFAAFNPRKNMIEKLANLPSFRATPASTFFRIFAVVFALIFVASVVITFLLPETYASTARIQVESDAPTANGQSQSYDPHFLQTTFEILQSEVVLSNVVSTLNLNSVFGKKYFGGETLRTTETIEFLRREMHLAIVRNTKCMTITFYSEDKNEAATLANAVVQAYRDYRQDQWQQLASKGIEALQTQFEKDEARIQVARSNVDSLRKGLQIADNSPNSFMPTPMAKVEESKTNDNAGALGGAPYWDAKREFEQMVDFHRMLAAKIEAEQLALQVPRVAMVTITDPAEPALRPVRPNKPLNIALGAIVGVFLAAAAGAIAALFAFLIGRRMRKTAAAA